MQRLRVIVGMEFSGVVRDEFIARGHDAVSCDLLPSISAKGPHLQCDIRDVDLSKFDLAIFHPECTYMCSSGLHWNRRRPDRAAKTEAALDMVRYLLGAPVERIALENPRGCIGTRVRPYTQTIQPHDFGEDASKQTDLWLVNLPPLVPTLRIPGRIVEWPRGSGKMVERWSNQTDSGQNRLPPSADRWAKRSVTYLGIAKAFADQWGKVNG